MKEKLKKIMELADELKACVTDAMEQGYDGPNNGDDDTGEEMGMDQGEDDTEEMGDNKPAKKALIIASLKRKAY